MLSFYRIRHRFLYGLALLIVLMGAVASLLPLYWMIVGSFERMQILPMPPHWLPTPPTLANYVNLFDSKPALRWLLNSVIVAGSICLGAVLTSTLAGYAFGKKTFPGQTVLFWLLLLTMMLPRHIFLIPLYLLMRRWEWVDTYQAMIVPYIAYPFGIFLIKQFMQTIPNDLIDAARIDGAGEWGIFARIILPLSKPAVGALAIFAFVAAWNEFIWQLIIVNSETMRTLPVGISTLVSQLGEYDLGLLMAGATVAFLPMLVLFLAFQEYFVKGITMGAVKG
jgi:multiple sugar transport system permease protein